jgi:methylated-DNA-[protein]-cysteine S-methyltransferase
MPLRRGPISLENVLVNTMRELHRLAPLETFAEIIDTPIGSIFAVGRSRGTLCLVEFADCPARIDRGLHRLGLRRSTIGRGELSPVVKAAFKAYFDGDVAALDGLPVELHGTAFQHEVWLALRRVPPGEVRAYGVFAERMGRPAASRAVGHANGANPLSIVVPCHRLVAADGSLTNYGGGLERKRWLLDHEARHAGRISRAALEVGTQS